MLKVFLSRWSFLLIILSCVIIYTPVLGFDFQRGWDDNWMVMNHYTVFGFSWINLKAVFTEYFNAQYGPVNQVIYTAIYTFFRYNPTVFHLYPLLLHIANSCLMLLFIKRLIGSRTDKNTASLVAFFTALIFAIHPLQVESVAWISASKIPLYTLFTLFGLLAYVRYSRTEKIGFYIIALLLFIVSFGCKEQTVVFPVTLIVLDIALGRSKSFGIEKSNNRVPERKSWGYLLLEKSPFILFAIFAGLSMYTNQSAGTIERWAGYPFGQRIVFSCYSIVEYVGKLILPVNLLHLYPFPMAPGKDLPLHFFIYPAAVLTALLFLLKVIKRNNWIALFGVLFFLVNMILVLHVVAMSRFSIIADRYVYLGSAGLFFIAVWYSVLWIKKMQNRSRKWVIITVTIYLLYLGCYAHSRTYAWKDSPTLKKEFLELIDEENLKTQ